MFENNAPDNSPGRLTSLRSVLAFDERRRFIFLFLVINALVLFLIWLLLQNKELVERVTVLEAEVIKVEAAGTRAVVDVTRCAVNCTDQMSTVAVMQGTKVTQLEETIEAHIPNTPIPATPTGTPTGTPTPSPTLTPTPTGTPTPTIPPTPTDTPTWTPTPLPTFTPTSTSLPPTDTPTSPEPTTPTPITPPPEVLGMTPAATVQGSGSALAFPVIIIGRNFVSGVAARLSENITITDIINTSTIITGMLSPDIPVGIYGLTVTNPDAQFDILSPAFIVYPNAPPMPLESPYLVTFGRNANPPYNNGYQTQLIFFEVPDNFNGNLYVNIFDADTGDTGDDQFGGFDTTIRYTLYGLTGTFTAPEAHAAPPLPAGIISGTPLTTTTIGISPTLDGDWHYIFGPLSPERGELVGNRYIFKLAVEGLSGDDANFYRVALSTSPDSNTVPSDLRMFTFSWVLLVSDGIERPLLHSYVEQGMTTFHLEGFGCDFTDGRLLIRTPFRNEQVRCPEINNGSADFDVNDGEDGMTWAIDFSEYVVPGGEFEYLGLWAEDQNSTALHTFTHPTTIEPPQ